jgi:hypothetical protein
MCELSIQDLGDTMKRSNLQIKGIEGDKVKAKSIENIFNKIIAEIL